MEKKKKNIKKYAVYAITAVIICYVVYVIVDMAGAKRGMFNRTTQHVTQNNNKEGYVRPDNSNNVQDEKFSEQVERIRIKTLAAYTADYNDIEIFEKDELFRNEYECATVFAFVTKNGNDLINRITGITLFKGDTSLVPIYKVFEQNDDEALIIAVVDNKKAGLIGNGLKIRVDLMDENGISYTKQQSLKMSDYKYKKGNIHGGDLCKISKNNFCLRVDNSEGTDVVVRDDVEAATMHYEFSNTFNLFNFGKSTGIDASLFKVDYNLPGGLADFNDIRYEVVAQKAFTRNEDPLLKDEKVLCNKRVKIVMSLDFNGGLADAQIAEYKNSLDKAVLMYGGLRFPMKHVEKTEKSRSEKLNYPVASYGDSL